MTRTTNPMIIKAGVMFVAMKVMTDEEKDFADLFLKSFGTLPSVDSISGPTNSSSVGK